MDQMSEVIVHRRDGCLPGNGDPWRRSALNRLNSSNTTRPTRLPTASALGEVPSGLLLG
jgi:hypothetical protein